MEKAELQNPPVFRGKHGKIQFLALCSFLLLPFLQGCYSFSASTLPAHIRTVHIPEVENRTLDPVLANRLRDGIVQMFRRQASGVRLVNENADADFKVVLLRYTNSPERFSRQSDVESYKSVLVVDVHFYDNRRKRDIYKATALSADGIYNVARNETEELHGQERAIQKLQELIITNALAKW